MEPLHELSSQLERGSNIDAILAEIDAEIASRRNLIAECERGVSALTKARALIAESIPSQAPAPSRSRHGEGISRSPSNRRKPQEASLAESVRRATRELLRREGRPLNRVDILRHLEELGITISSADPGKRVGKIIWASREYQHLGTGYWFKDETPPS